MAVTPNSLVTTQGTATAYALCTAAKTTYSDTTGAVQFTGLPATNGALVKKIRAYPKALTGAAITATQLIVWLTKAADTTNANPIPVASALMGAYTMGQTTALPATDLGQTSSDPLRLDGGDKLWASIGVAPPSGNIAFVAEYEPF